MAGPFGGTIAHGYLTLSLGPTLLQEVIDVAAPLGSSTMVSTRRFPAPVRIGSRIRLGAELRAVDEVPGGFQASLELTFAVEAQEKPACVAEALFRFYA